MATIARSIWLLLASMVLAPVSMARETVLIAVEDDWAPYASVKADKSGPEGLTVDLIQAAFDVQGIDVQFLTVPFARCLLYAETGRTVGCANATIVAGNRDAYIWHPTPLFSEELAIFARSGSGNESVDLTLKDLEGETVSVTIGYTYPTEFLDNPRIVKYPVNSDALQLQMLVNGRVKYALLNTMPAYLRINAQVDLRDKVRRVGRVSNDGFWVAFSKRHVDGARFAEALEAGLKKLHASGRYAAMLKAFRQRVGYQPRE